MSDLVTGDAVVVELRLAMTASRGLAFVIDLLVQILMLTCMFVLLMISMDSIDKVEGTSAAPASPASGAAITARSVRPSSRRSAETTPRTHDVTDDGGPVFGSST